MYGKSLPEGDLVIERTATTMTIALLPPPREGWTPREREVIECIRDGFGRYFEPPPMEEIAAQLCIARATLKNRLHGMMKKHGFIEHTWQLAFVRLE